MTATTTGRTRQAWMAKPSARPQHDERLREHLFLAGQDDEIALQIIWAEFQIDYAREGGRYDLD